MANPALGPFRVRGTPVCAIAAHNPTDIANIGAGHLTLAAIIAGRDAEA